MPLTDAERAKRYREKKKQRDPSFIEKERKRQQMQRVPRGEMAPNRLLSARNKCAGYKKTAKERRKTAENIESTVCDTATQDQPQTMIVTLPAVAQQKRRHTLVATRNQQISQHNDTNKKIDNVTSQDGWVGPPTGSGKNHSNTTSRTQRLFRQPKRRPQNSTSLGS